MRHAEWMEPDPAQERQIEQRRKLRNRPERLHLRAADNGTLEIVAYLHTGAEKSVQVPRSIETELLDAVFPSRVKS